MDETTKEINRILAHEPCIVQHCTLDNEHEGDHVYDPEDFQEGTPDPEPVRIDQARTIFLTEDVEDEARKLVAALKAGEFLRADRMRASIANALERLADELAPHGRHDACGEPLNEDGECPTWCDQ